MAIPAEFYEREYENFFNRELERLGGFVWTPGQLDENILGFDAGAWLPLIFLFSWKEYRKTFFPLYDLICYFFKRKGRGVVLDRKFMEDWEDFMNAAFPPRKLNFFVQYKRPCLSSRMDEAGQFWRKPYYQYYINKNQQRRLALLEHKLGESGVVTYSCPAFHTKDELWEFQNKKRIIRMSNFVGPGKINGHSRYTFVELGHHGLQIQIRKK